MQRKQDLSSLTVTSAEDWIADYNDEALFDLFMLRQGDGSASSASAGRRMPRLSMVEPCTPPRIASTTNGALLPRTPAPVVLQSAKRPRHDSHLAGALPPNDECTICMDAPSKVRLVPCGHRVLCAGCARRVDMCPLCRARIISR